MNNSIKFYEGSYQFNVIKDVNLLNLEYIKQQFYRLYCYRKFYRQQINESLWAEITINGINERYIFDKSTFELTQIKFN